VILLNRPSERSQKSLAALKEAVPNGNFEPIDCDLQSFDSVRKAAEEVKQKCPEGLYALCNNAGVMALEDKATPDGYDVQMQTNHLSHFLLTAELFPLLEKAANMLGDARVVNHTSSARMVPDKVLKAEYLGKNGGNLGGNSASMFFGGARWKRYNQSKLANCAFTAALHNRLQKKGPKLNLW
jgi:NAD(P)-dependent dehydrogenase (short-subunit alcohol dehydrogenase family)